MMRQICAVALVFTFSLCLTVTTVEGGECCKAHDGPVYYNDAMWCPDYCCFNLAEFSCCSTEILQAPADDRSGYCIQWMSEHVWAPILIVVGSLGAIIGLCVCCCCCCCAACRSSPSPGTVMLPSTPNVTVVNSTSSTVASSHGNPFNAGYDQPK